MLRHHLRHEALERSRGIAEPEWHAVPFEKSKWASEGSLVLVFLGHGHLVITTGRVQGREEFGTAQGI